MIIIDKIKDLWQNTFSKDESKILSYIFVAALFLRVFYVIETENTAFFTNLFSDSQIYNQWAVEISNGNWIGNEAYFMAPAYPYILGALYSIFGDSTLIVRLLQSIISSLNIFLIFLIARNIFGRREGYIAALVSALYSIFIFYSGAILSETFQVFIISILLVQSTSPKLKNRTIKWFLLGISIGIAALFRANILLFPVLIFIAELIKILKGKIDRSFGIKSLLLLFLGVLLPIIPVTVRNYVVSDDFVLLTSNGGINFYLGNNSNSEGVFVAPQEFDFYSDLSGRKYAESRLGIELSPSEASSYWFGRGTDYIISNPIEYLALEFKKLVLLFGESENPQSTIMDPQYFADNYSRVLQLPLFHFFFISLFSLAGFVLLWQNLKKKPLSILFLISGIIGTILFFVNGRFRLMLTPLLIVIASGAIIRIYEMVKSNEFLKLKTAGGTILLFVVIYFFGINVPAFNEYDAYFHLGKVAMDEKKYDDAVDYFNRSLMLRDYFQTYVNLGNALAMKQDYENALKIYDIAIEKNPDYILAYFNKALALTQKGDLDKAMELYKKVLEMDPDYEGAYRNIGIIYYISENYEQALPYFEKFVSLTKDDQLKASVQYDIETIKKRIRAKKQENK